MIIRKSGFKRQSQSGNKCKVPCFVVLSYIDSGDDTAASVLDCEKRKDCQQWCKQKHVDVHKNLQSHSSTMSMMTDQFLELQLTTNNNDRAESELVSALIALALALAIAIGIRFIEIQCSSNI